MGGGWSMQKGAGSKPKLVLHDNQGLNFWKIAHGVIAMLLVQIGDYVRNANPRFLQDWLPTICKLMSPFPNCCHIKLFFPFFQVNHLDRIELFIKYPKLGVLSSPVLAKQGTKNEKSGWKQYTGIKKHGTKLGFSLKLVHPPFWICLTCALTASQILHYMKAQVKIRSCKPSKLIPSFTHFVPIHSNWEWNRV